MGILLLLQRFIMAREEFLDELSDQFPSQAIYSYDETFRYDTDRLALMDSVLDGSFDKYECNVPACNFRYEITADAVFHLKVAYNDNVWKKTFSYITEAFEIGEAAYRFFIAVPRAMSEGEALSANEEKHPIEKESYLTHDHCLDNNAAEQAEIIFPPCFRAKGKYVHASVFLCTDDSYLLSIIHICPAGKHRNLLEVFFTDEDFAKLIAKAYLENFDREVCPSPLDEVYQHVYRCVTH
jgi:hypothetical protein